MVEFVSLHLLDGATVTEPPRRVWPARIAFATATGAALFVALGPFTPPLPSGAIAPADTFSALRAARHVEVLAAAASRGDAAAYIESQLAALGIPVPLLPGEESGDIVVRLRGLEPSGAVLIAAPYARPSGVAAAAAVLETARALRTMARPRNDVVLAFPAEGGSGLERLLRTDAALGDVVLVLAVGGPGRRGPSALLASGPGSSRFLSDAATVVPHPLVLLPTGLLASWLGASVPLGVPSFNAGRAGLAIGPFADALGPKLDLATLQDDGTTALALVRHFAAVPLGARPAGDVLAFNVGRAVLRYPAGWARPLALASAVLAAALLALGIARRRLSLAGLAVGTGAFLAAVVASGALAALFNAVLRSVRPGALRPELLAAAWFVMAAAVAGFLDAALRNRRGLGDAALPSGALLAWMIASLAAGYAFPEVSPAVVWPLLLLAPAFLVLFLLHTPAHHPWLRTAALTVAAIPAVLLAAPLYVVVTSLPGRTGLEAAVAAALSAFFLSAFLSSLPLVSRRWIPPAVAALVALALLGAAAVVKI